MPVTYTLNNRIVTLYYSGGGTGSGLTDAHWGSSDDRRSIGGYTFLLCGAAVCWNSKKQATVALSSTEAEYMALTQAVKESLCLQGILFDIGAANHVPDVKRIYVDNQRAIALSRNTEFHARTKHIGIQYHFIREHIENQQIQLTYCATSEMTADIFNKSLPEPSFTKHTLGLGLVSHSTIKIQNVRVGHGHSSKKGVRMSTGEGRSCESPALIPWSPDIVPPEDDGRM